MARSAATRIFLSRHCFAFLEAYAAELVYKFIEHGKRTLRMYNEGGSLRTDLSTFAAGKRDDEFRDVGDLER